MRIVRVGRRRLVRSALELADKVRVFDAGLDDRLVEAVKVMLWSGLTQEQRARHDRMLFGGLAQDDSGAQRVQFFLLGPGSQAELSVSRADFDANAAPLAPLLPDAEQERGQWLHVGREYGVALLQRWRPL